MLGTDKANIIGVINEVDVVNWETFQIHIYFRRLLGPTPAKAISGASVPASIVKNGGFLDLLLTLVQPAKHSPFGLLSS